MKSDENGARPVNFRWRWNNPINPAKFGVRGVGARRGRGGKGGKVSQGLKGHGFALQEGVSPVRIYYL